MARVRRWKCMTSLTIWLYASSGAVIGLLSVFAIHNQRVGWKKSRTTLAEALNDFYSDLGLGVEQSHETERAHIITARRVEAHVDPIDFSDQLIRLTEALGGAAVKPTEATTEETKKSERELVPVQVR